MKASQSFARAADRLDQALRAPESDLQHDGAIQRFEFCFELAWKALQHELRAQGLDCASPRACLAEAFRQGWIEQAAWLAMMADHNLTSHTYDEQLARAVYSRLAGHAATLRALLERLQRV